MTQPVSMEADTAGGKPFDAASADAARATAAPAASGEPATQPASQPASPEAMAALGVNAPPQAPTPQATPPAPGSAMDSFMQNLPPAAQPAAAPVNPLQTPEAQAAGKAAVDNYSAAIQTMAEEAYALASHNALTDASHLDRMIESGDPTQVKIAEKVIERNSEHFKAKSLEEYKANAELAKAGDDPTKLELASLKQEQAKMKKERADEKWSDFKIKQKIEANSEFDALCDTVRKEYPNAPMSDVIHTARGRAGIDPTKFVAGGVVETQHGLGGGDKGGGKGDGDLPSESLQKQFGIKPGVSQSAERYFSGLSSPGIKR